MGDDIETDRSTDLDYLAAKRWLSRNQNKQPQMTDPNQCHHPIITQLTPAYVFQSCLEDHFQIRIQHSFNKEENYQPQQQNLRMK